MITVIDATAQNPRLLVLTAIGADPDDQMSMVRLLTYSNQIDIEGLAATHVNGQVNPERILRIVDAYGKVRDNLELHEPGFPTEDYLDKVIAQGLPVDGMQAVGEGNDSPTSGQLIRAVDHGTPRLTRYRRVIVDVQD